MYSDVTEYILMASLYIQLCGISMHWLKPFLYNSQNPFMWTSAIQIHKIVYAPRCTVFVELWKVCWFCGGMCVNVCRHMSFTGI